MNSARCKQFLLVLLTLMALTGCSSIHLAQRSEDMLVRVGSTDVTLEAAPYAHVFLCSGLRSVEWHFRSPLCSARGETLNILPPGKMALAVNPPKMQAYSVAVAALTAMAARIPRTEMAPSWGAGTPGEKLAGPPVIPEALPCQDVFQPEVAFRILEGH